MTKEALSKLLHREVEDTQILRIVPTKRPYSPIFGILEARCMDGSYVVFSSSNEGKFHSATHDQIRSLRFLSSRQLARIAQKSERLKK